MLALIPVCIALMAIIVFRDNTTVERKTQDETGKVALEIRNAQEIKRAKIRRPQLTDAAIGSKATGLVRTIGFSCESVAFDDAARCPIGYPSDPSRRPRKSLWHDLALYVDLYLALYVSASIKSG